MPIFDTKPFNNSKTTKTEASTSNKLAGGAKGGKQPTENDKPIVSTGGKKPKMCSEEATSSSNQRAAMAKGAAAKLKNSAKL